MDEDDRCEAVDNDLWSLPCFFRPVATLWDTPMCEGHFLNELGDITESIQAWGLVE